MTRQKSIQKLLNYRDGFWKRLECVVLGDLIKVMPPALKRSLNAIKAALALFVC